MNGGLEKKYGLVTAIALVVGIVIGSGVFFKAQTILEMTGGNLVLGIIAWIIGAAIMIVSMLAFATMATRYEKVNGVVDYAEAIVGEKYGYAMGWFMTFIYTPCIASCLAWLTARYTLVAVVSAFPDFRLTTASSADGVIASSDCILLAMMYMIGIYAVNTLSPVIAGKLQVATTAIKLIPIFLMATVGIVLGIFSEDGVLIENMMNTGRQDMIGNPLFGAVVATAFAYEGWIIATSINSELKNAKRNLPIALIAGGIIIAAAYILYYIGVAGAATTDDLIQHGATIAFYNMFGKVGAAVLNVFVAVSCLGTLNGLMLGCTRNMYSIAQRGEGPRPEIFAKVDSDTDMPTNSAIIGLLMSAFWLVFFHVGQIGPKFGATNWFGVFAFDSSEIPIVTLYAMYIPIFILFMKKSTDLGAVKRFIIPALAVCGSIFEVVAAVYAHGYQPYINAAADGKFSCPVVFYLILFTAVMAIGLKFRNGTRKSDKKAEEKAQ